MAGLLFRMFRVDRIEVKGTMHTPKQPQNSEYFKDNMLRMQAQKNRVALDEEQLLFITAADYDAFDSDVDEAPTLLTMFMENLSSVDPVNDEADPSYDSDILSETPIISPTIPPSSDYTPASPDYSPASEIKSNPFEDPSSGYIPPLPAVLPFLSLDDDTTDSDTPDTPPSSTHGTPFIEITASTQRSPVIPHHSSLDLPSTSAGPSRKRCRSPMTSIPALPPISGDLSPVRADLIPSPKRVRDIGYLADVEVGLRETGVERVTHPAMPEDIPEPAQEGAVEVTYETLRDLVQRFHDHTQAISVHRIQVIEGVQREQGHRIVGVESAVTALTERVAELERDNRRLRGTAGVETEEMEAREAARNLKTLNENGDEQEVENGGNKNEGNGDNEGNETGGNRGNGNGGNGENENHGMNYGGQCFDLVYCSRNEVQKIETELWNLTVKETTWLLTPKGNVIAANPARLQDTIRIANQLMDKKLQGYATRSAENKRRMESNPRDNH
nr:hypothetical protein [Tanacetum cinerariifolium]